MQVCMVPRPIKQGELPIPLLLTLVQGFTLNGGIVGNLDKLVQANMYPHRALQLKSWQHL